MSRVNQPVLQLLPARARSVGPSAGLLEGPEGGVVFVFGLATFGYASADLAGRRLAAVQLVTTKIAAVGEVASAFGVNEATLWRWKRAFGAGGVLGLVTERPGPRRPSKLNTSLAARIVKLDATGLTVQQIVVATGVSTATVRVALGRVAPRDQAPVEDDVDEPEDGTGNAELIVLAAPVPRTADRVAARFGDLAEAPVVITEGAQLPLAGLLLALPGLEMTGLLPVAGEVFPPMRKGFYGLRATLLMGVFLALPGLEMTGLLPVAGEVFPPMREGFYGLRATLLMGVFLALPGLEMTGLLPVAGEVFPPMRKGFYGLRATLLMGVFLALPGLEMTGLLPVAGEVFPPMRKGFYGLRATLLMGVFLALPGLEMTGLLPVAGEVFPPMRKGFYGLRATSLMGVFLALPGLEMTGLLPVAGEVFPPMRKGFYGLRATLLMGVFLALPGLEMTGLLPVAGEVFPPMRK